MQAALNSPAESKRSTSWWAALFKSPLAKTLMGGFLLIATIEAAFMAVLCIDVQQANKSAAREFELLHGSQQISHVIKSAQKCIDAADLARKTPNDQARFNVYKSRYDDTINDVNGVIASFEKVGFDTAGAIRLRDSFAQLNEIVNRVLLQTRRTGDVSGAYKLVLVQTGHLYGQFLTEIRAVHDALKSSGDAGSSIGGLAPQNVLYIAALVNIIMLMAMVLLVERGITRPISRLASNCAYIISGRPMPSPTHKGNEIASLEQSFYEMSLVVSANEQRRHSFLEFFQSVQSAALENVRKCFDALLEQNLGDRARKNIQKARTNLSTLFQLLQSMTDALSFKADSSIDPKYEECTSGSLTASAHNAVEALLQKRNITLQIEDPNLACSLDSHLIGRVLANFLSNAIKYSPESGTVRLKVSKLGDMLQFRVEDQGPGIAAEDQAKLFKEFSQVNAADGIKRSGTGLGLVICKQIVEAHGGEVGIESEVGKGSCFWFRVPAVRSRRAAGAPAVDEIARSANKKSEQTTGLKRTFIILLFVLLIPQSLIFLKLHSMFDTASKRAASFHGEKEVLMDSEEMLGMYLTWKLDIAKAIDSMQVNDLGNTTKGIDEILDQAELMRKESAPGSPSREEIKKITHGLNKLRKFTEYIDKNRENLNLAVMPKLVEQARKLAKIVETGVFKVMTIEESNIQNSFDGSVEMQNELISALLIAAAINSLLLAAVCVIGLRITEKIADLKHKAADFACGKRLEPSLKTKDELGYLDARLCEVSQAIKDAETQRQKLIAVINHDLRTPLSSIINGLEMILASGYGDIGEKEKALTTAAEHELNKLLQQINDLLLIEKIDAGLYQMTPEKFEIFPLLAATAESFGETASRKRVRLVPASAPECQDLCINGDRSLVEREFAIIISNAVEAAPSGSTIDVAIERSGNVISVSFKDHGKGIDEELLPQIFERFRFVGGKPVTGLGLPLAQRLSAIHGGSLEINSSPSGTETRVTLPIAV